MKLELLLPAMLLCLWIGCGSDESRRHYEKEGGFSIVPPDGWQVQEMPRLKYRVFSGPPVDGFAPNISIVDETADDTLDEYAMKDFANLKLNFAGLEQVDGGDIQLDDGRRAVKMVLRHTQFGPVAEQTFYFVGGSGATKYIVTCSKRADDAREWDTVFDACVRSFRLESG